jgi:hypothetical protein
MHGAHPIYGEVIVTLQKLLISPYQRFDLINPTSKAIVGTLSFDNIQFHPTPSLVDYLRSGWFINMACAIDFTASNGELIDPKSLHR